MTQDQNPEVSVVPTQADREAAADNIKRRLVWQHGDEQPWMDAGLSSMRMGEQDNHAEVVAFARHRLAHQAAPATQPGAGVGEVEQEDFDFAQDIIEQLIADRVDVVADDVGHLRDSIATACRNRRRTTFHTPPPVATATVEAGCTVPPAGWRCTRAAGHSGPCAAVPTDEPPSVEDAWRSGFAAAEEALGAHGSEWLLGAIENAWAEFAADHALAATPTPQAGDQ